VEAKQWTLLQQILSKDFFQFKNKQGFHMSFLQTAEQNNQIG